MSSTIPTHSTSSTHAVPNLLSAKEVLDICTSPGVTSTIYEIKNATDTVVGKSKMIFSQLEETLTTTPADALIQRVHATCTRLEKTFNVLGCMPFIGAASGGLRAVLGHIQVLAGAAFAALGEIGVFVCHQRKSEAALAHKWKSIAVLGAEMILHGCLNIMRGYGEAVLGQYSFGLANIVLLVPNVYKEDAFSPYLAYGTLNLSHVKHASDLEQAK